MKKKDLQKLRKESLAKLRSETEKKKLEIVTLVAKIKAGKSTNIKEKRTLKRDISQIMTIIREKEITKKDTGDSEQKSKNT